MAYGGFRYRVTGKDGIVKLIDLKIEAARRTVPKNQRERDQRAGALTALEDFRRTFKTAEVLLEQEG
jgi:hypothetical protein